MHPNPDLPVVVARANQDVLTDEADNHLEGPHVYRWYKKGVFAPPSRVLPYETVENLIAHVQFVIDGEPLPLTPTIWNATMTRFAYVFCVFYWPWEPNFQTTEPTWDAFAAKVGEDDSLRGLLRVAKMDCTKYENFCRDLRVLASPLFRWYLNGELVSSKYRGARTVEAFMEYANQTIFA